MTSNHWRIYATAIITFLIGGSNALFGAHLSSAAIGVDAMAGMGIIAAEIAALIRRDPGAAIADLEKLAPVVVDIVKQIRAGLPPTNPPAK